MNQLPEVPMADSQGGQILGRLRGCVLKSGPVNTSFCTHVTLCDHIHV